jgi:hypothetical protein
MLNEVARDRVAKPLDYLPTSLSSSLMIYAPISVSPPKQATFLRASEAHVKIRRVPKEHSLEQSFKPYLRARDHVGVITRMYKRYGQNEFDGSIEGQNRFLHETPKNKEFKASRMPEVEKGVRAAAVNYQQKTGIFKRNSNRNQLPPLFESFYHRFNSQFSDLSISNQKIKSSL